MSVFESAKKLITNAKGVNQLDNLSSRLSTVYAYGKNISEEELAELSALIARRRSDMNGA